MFQSDHAQTQRNSGLGIRVEARAHQKGGDHLRPSAEELHQDRFQIAFYFADLPAE